MTRQQWKGGPHDQSVFYALGFYLIRDLHHPIFNPLRIQDMLDFINTLDQNSAAILAKQASSAMSDRAAPNTSDRYGFVDTGKAIEILHGHGFNVVSAMQQKARLKDDQPFAAHMLRFENLAYTNDSGTMPQILLLNSHNTRTSLGLGQGCFRYACSNNIVLASAGVFTRLRHNLATVAGFEDMVREQAKALPVTMQRIESMQRAEIDLDQAAQWPRTVASLGVGI
jgi:hypothetical protein